MGMKDLIPDLFVPPEPPRKLADDIPREVRDLFASYAVKVKRSGFARYSADAILHRIRWHYHVERGDREFKCNNNWTSVLSRWAMAEHPELADFFETRASPGANRECV